MNAPVNPPTPAASEELQPGALFGRYEIVRRIGSGGAGTVYEARHLDLQKPVALKTLHAEYARDPVMRARFLSEGQATSRLRHPHVVDVSDYGVEDGAAFLVMEYLEGEDLASLLAREGSLPPERIVELLVPICSAVAAAHEAGIVHRDLKPENIFLARNALGQIQPKVLDFGISKRLDAGAESYITNHNDLVGTPCYMAPEYARGARDPDALSDQYALGVILYECVVGRLPFDATSLYALLRQITEGAYAAPRALRPEVPPRFERAILRAMHTEPARRFPSVVALARELLAFAPTLARNTWEPLLAPPPDANRPNDPYGEDPTSTFRAPWRHGVATAPHPRVNTLDPRAREIARPARPCPMRGSNERAVVALSALCTLLAVIGAVHLRLHALHEAPAVRAVAAHRPAHNAPPSPPPPTPVALRPVVPAVVTAPEATPAEEPHDRHARQSRTTHRQRRSRRSPVEG